MTVVAAFKDGWTALRGSPKLVIAGLAVALAGYLPTVGEAVASPAGSVVAGVGFLLAFPFALAGLTGMAHAALGEDGASLGTFTRTGLTCYLRVLVGGIALIAAVFAFSMLTFPITFLPAVAVIFAGLGETASLAAMAFAAVVGLVTIPATLLLVLLLQFYGAAVVVDDVGVVASLRRSAGLVRRNLLSVIGFTLLWWLVSGAVAAPETIDRVIEVATDGGGGSFELSVVLAPVALAVTAVGFAYLHAVYTAYYVRLSEASAGDDGAPISG